MGTGNDQLTNSATFGSLREQTAYTHDKMISYRPCAEILNGTWKFPEAQPVG
jgi:hypothetical protein